MGAHINKSQSHLNQCLYFKHDLFHINELDQIIERGLELIKSTEAFRCQFIPLWNDFIMQSGAIVIQSPNCKSAINGLLMKISSDLNGVLFQKLWIHSTSPFITYTFNECDISSDCFVIIKSFKSICLFYVESINRIKEIEISYRKVINDLGDFPKDFRISWDQISNSYKVLEYIKKFKNGYNICIQIKNCLEEISFCLKEYEELTKNEETIQKFEQIGKEAYKNNIVTPSKIVFKYSLEKKISNYNGYYARVDDFKKIEKNCQLSFQLSKIEPTHAVQKTREIKNVIMNFDNRVKNFTFQKERKQMTNEVYNSGEMIFEQINLRSTINIYPDKKDYPTAFAYVQEKDLLITGMSNGILIFTNKTTVSEEKVLLCHCRKITSLISLSDNNTIISGSKDGIIYKHDLDYYESSIIGSEDSIDAMTDLNNGFTILVASNYTVIAYDYMENRELYSFKAHDDQIKDLIYYSSKDLLITSSKDKKIKLWNLINQECIGVIKGITHIINSLCFAQKNDDLILAGTSKDGHLILWNLTNKSIIKTFKMKTASVKVVNVNAKQTKVISINENGTLTLFNIDSHEEKHLNIHQSHIKYTTGLYCNDNNTIAIGAKHALVQLWSIDKI